MWDKNLENNEKEGLEEGNSELEAEIERLSEMGEDFAFSENEDVKSKLLNNLKNNLVEQALGKDSNYIRKDINNLGRAKKVIDWRNILLDTTKYNMDWSYKNAYIEDGMIVANLEEQDWPETEILISNRLKR